METIDANGGRYTSTYDNVGNVTKVVDARKNATVDPNDYTTLYGYDLNHRVTAMTDAAAHVTRTEYDKDGLATAEVDQEGNRRETAYDARGMAREVRVPHDTGVIRTTRYEYDEVGNQTKAITPRGVATTDDPDDFAHVTVYDALNRVKEKLLPYDREDPRYNTVDKVIYTYDEVGRMTKVSAPPSEGQTVRNDTLTSYFDNGWVRSTTDPWDIATTYEYNVLGQQTRREVASAGGSTGRTITWDYYPDGKLRSKSDTGVPVGKHVVLVDNSDSQHVTATGTWGTSSSGTGFQGYDYRTHAAGSTDTFTWRLTVPADGNYQVWVKYPAATATDAPYKVRHADGDTTVPVDQTQNPGQWVSLGSQRFTEGIAHSIELGTSATGSVAADAVKLVRDTSGDPPDNESKAVTQSYDPNGNLTSVTDTSSGALVDSYTLDYDVLNRLSTVEERAGGVLRDTTGYTYDENSNLLTRSHNRQNATFTYDIRDLLGSVTVTESGVTAKTTTSTYTPRGQRLREVKGNGHTVAYDPNSNRTRDEAKTQNADNTSNYLDRVYTYDYDPRDRLAQLTKTPAGGSAVTETYTHDANDNVVSQTVTGVTTTYGYDRNRLQSTTTAGSSSYYNYDPYGRLDTVVSGGQVIEKYTYDGFDRTLEHSTGTGTNAKTTRYAYDPLDRTTSRTDKAGTPQEKTTRYHYLGTAGEIAAEEIGTNLERTYQYGPDGERLSMVKRTNGTSPESSYYSYNTRGDVDAITGETGTTRATYGYTAYGSPDNNLYTGVDKPDPNNPDKEPYNPYRYNAKRVDPASGNYDMGFRDYSPNLNRFTTRDLYNGALADIGMTANPFTMNRYAYTSGNPINRIENDGHCWYFDWAKELCEDTGEAVSDAWDATTDWAEETWEDTKDWADETWEDTKDWADETWEDTKDWATEHADVVGGVAGLVVGVGCTALTLGVGALACGALGGAVAGGLTAGLKGGDWGDVLKGAAVGAIFGLAGGAFGGVAGAFLGKAGVSILSGAGRSALGNGLRAAQSAGRGLLSREQGQVLTIGGLKGLFQTHRALLGHGSLGRGVYGRYLKEGLPNATGSGIVGGFIPSNPDEIGNWSPLNMIQGFFTGF
jgi:RHS repeat-associated protein